ncbi:conserved hypothetical protein [Treponema phagedenis]|uniref:AAA-ATPase-like domain-containing protein n=2 Tax=Treponema phagedenis TaxID=162 RepID=A0A0B7H0A8_TREPH|nr:conserved hypothetical protein [Treponema phagedenis]
MSMLVEPLHKQSSIFPKIENSFHVCYTESMTDIRKMPVGVQSFKVLRENNFLYVDKTEFLRKLVNSSKTYVLHRPRRFGKSLFLSMLEAYFCGQKELFAGLKIEGYEAQQNEPWQKYPVLHLDFNPNMYDTKEDLEDLLDNYLRKWEDVYGRPDTDYNISQRFSNVIENAYNKTGKQVVILVDEYDKPLLQTMNVNEELNETYRSILKGFYGVIKSSDEYIRLAFLTGVTKFSKVSIFSDLNNLKDISLLNGYSEICGITQEELEHNFQPEIKAISEKYNYTREEVLERLRKNYDGYLFHQNGKHVYNPFSLLNALDSKEFTKYWFATGTPTFLVNLLKQAEYDLRDVTERAELDKNALFDYRPSMQNPIPIFFQSGYLTIKSYNEEFELYKLGFPNMEVKQVFFDNMLPSFTSIVKDETGLYIKNFVCDMREGNVQAFMERLYTACASLPYSTASKKDKSLRERDYQIAFYIIFTLMGYYAEIETHSSKGRADLVLRTDKAIYIFEFKLAVKASADDALNQIKEKGYADKYKKCGKEIFLIGAVFGDDITAETPGMWKMEELN